MFRVHRGMVLFCLVMVESDCHRRKYSVGKADLAVDLESVHAACVDMIKIFHQSSILIQANETTTEFYYGA